MSLLAAKNYDPAALVSKSMTTNSVMTALDTTNLRVTFDGPASGNVLVRLKSGLLVTGYPMPGFFFGVLDGATVRVRGVPMGTVATYAAGATYQGVELVATVTGLTPGASYTWDAAYAVDLPNSNATLRYGGPSDTFSQNAGGAFTFEVWAA